MKFKLHYTHNFWKYKDVEINSIEELLELVEEKGCGIIVDFQKDNWTLEVYDDYRE